MKTDKPHRSLSPSSRPQQVLSRLVLVAGSFCAAGGVASAASVAPVAAENGMVVTAQRLATKVGVDVLQAGGNAVDAAVAVGYALAVVYPAAGNLGGGGFMTIQLADGRRTFLDFREKAPLAATPGMYLDAAGNVVKGASTSGHLAVGIPGTVSGLETAREKYGTLPRRALLAPAIAFAERGFVLEQGDLDLLLTGTEDFRKDAATAAIFLDRGKPLRRRRQAGAEGPRPDAAGDLARPVRRASTRARWRRRSSPPARPAAGSSPRPTSTNTRRANSRRWNATTAACMSSRRRRRVRAGWRSARCSTS